MRKCQSASLEAARSVPARAAPVTTNPPDDEAEVWMRAGFVGFERTLVVEHVDWYHAVGDPWIPAQVDSFIPPTYTSSHDWPACRGSTVA